MAAVIAKFDLTFADGEQYLRDTMVVDGPQPALVRRHPLGPAAVIAPYNFPIHLGHGAAVSYLLAGNTVLFKPSPLAVNTGLAYAQAMRKGALPPNVEVHEFFLQAGQWLSNASMQQSYASLSYAHVAAHLEREGVNVLAQENVEELFPLPEDFTGTGGDLFMLRVRGDSMVDAGILDRDTVFLTPREPRPRDIVAALIDGESTLKRFLVQRGLPFLRAENPRYPDLIPARELMIQGVMVGLLRAHA